MLQLYPVYLLCNRRKTLTGSNGTNKPCTAVLHLSLFLKNVFRAEVDFINNRYNNKKMATICRFWSCGCTGL